MSRHFVAVAGRTVHYRRWGEGPVVLAIHGSPQSSRAMAPLARVLSEQGHTVIAPDTPGNGLSTPLAGEPASADYADALLQFADALGLGRFGLTGYHTGAATICAFAARYPARVSAIVFNGLSCWTEAERRSLTATYLPPLVPAWDGSHMAWVWARLEEQTIFFPWNEPTPATRMMRYVLPSLAALHSNALDLLESGDGYRAPYASAFGFKTEQWLHRVAAPCLIAATATDPLRAHLDRPPLSTADFRNFEDSAALFDAAAAHLGAHPGDPAPPPPPSGADAAGLASGMVEGLAWTGRLAGAGGRPLLLLHEAGGSARRFRPILSAIASTRPMMALDLPGHGASADGWTTRIESIDQVADIVGTACRALGVDHPAVAGDGFGARIGAAMTGAGSAGAAASLGALWSHAAEPMPEPLPSLAPEWDGAHLLRAFRIARWERLFRPWHRRDQAHVILGLDLDPTNIHARAVDLIHASSAWHDAVAAERRWDLASAERPVTSLPNTGSADLPRELSMFGA